MKIKFILIMPIMLLMLSFNVYSYSPYITFGDNRTLDFNPDVWCSVNGQFIDFNSNGIPFFCYTENLPEGWVNYVPVRTIAEALGLEVAFDASSHAIELKGNGLVMRFWEGSSDIAYFDWQYNSIDSSSFTTPASTPCPVRLIEGTTYVPIRAVAESFGRVIDFKNNQLMIADSAEGLAAAVKDELSKTVKIHGLYPDISVSKNTNLQNYDRFLENNGLKDLTGFLCYNGTEWTIGTAASELCEFNMVIEPKYFEYMYFKSNKQAGWIKFGEDEDINNIYDISFDIKEISTDNNTHFLFKNTEDISDNNYRAVVECLQQYIELPKKMTAEEYTASYSPVITDKNIDSMLYRIQTSESPELFYVLLTDSQAKLIDKSIFDNISFTQTTTISLPELGSLTIYSEVIIVDIVDDNK